MVTKAARDAEAAGHEEANPHPQQHRLDLKPGEYPGRGMALTGKRRGASSAPLTDRVVGGGIRACRSVQGALRAAALSALLATAIPFGSNNGVLAGATTAGGCVFKQVRGQPRSWPHVKAPWLASSCIVSPDTSREITVALARAGWCSRLRLGGGSTCRTEAASYSCPLVSVVT